MTENQSKAKYIAEFTDKYNFIYCEKCHRSALWIYDVHHIFSKRDRPKHELLNDPINFVILCRDCHKSVHGKKDNDFIIKIKKERNLYELFGEWK